MLPARCLLSRYICLHGHFYQPPRENPWLEEVERQDSAAPFHDWNQRITEECYAPNTAARILNEQGKIEEIVNNYSRISFNFGPTLLSWLERRKPEVYRHIIESDKESQKLFSGHGSAIAQCYNHMIMPLASSRDKRTQVAWGIRDFEFRFGRLPEGMWLPETAVDLETLEVLAERGIRFTILSPRQARRIRPLGGGEWQDVAGERVDPRRPYRVALPSGRTIGVFFYDGPMAKDVAFGDLLYSGQRFAQRIVSAFSQGDSDELTSIATDGESYGHHHRFGDMALAFCLREIDRKKMARVTIYAEYLERVPPAYEVEIFERSSWSCVHGVERWRADCGCCSGGNPGWHQRWRAPLRAALDGLRERIDRIFEAEAGKLFTDPWEARDRYIDVILKREDAVINRFFNDQGKASFQRADRMRALHLLEMERHAMLMYTSCGWFFDEISGIETVQILQYAAKAIQLAREVTGEDLSEGFLRVLQTAESNVARYANGTGVFKECVQPFVLNMERVGAHYAMMSLFEEYPDVIDIYCYQVRARSYEKIQQRESRIALGDIVVHSKITSEERELFFIVLHLGGHDLFAAISMKNTERSFVGVRDKIVAAFKANRSHQVVRIMKKFFENGPYSLRHLFKDEQSRILYQILDASLHEVESSLRQINEHYHSIIDVVRELRVPLPKVLSNTILVMLNTDLMRALGATRLDFKHLEQLVAEAIEWSLDIDRVTISFFVSRRLRDMMDALLRRPQQVRTLRDAAMLVRIFDPLKLHLDLGKAQNIYFSIGKKYYDDMRRQAATGQAQAAKWVEFFDELGGRLNIEMFIRQ